MEQKVPRRALERAIEVFGEQAVSERLGVSVERMNWWVSGSVPVPHHAFLQLVDLLLEHGLATLRQEIRASAGQRDAVGEGPP